MKKLTFLAIAATYFLGSQTAFATERVEIVWTKLSNHAQSIAYAALPADSTERAGLYQVANRFSPVLVNPGILEFKLRGQVMLRMVNDGERSYVTSN